jgi:hypothetical protein
MLSSPGRWLLALPRTNLIDEQAAALTVKALKARLPLTVKAIHSAQTNKKGKVARRIHDALTDPSSSANNIVLITHEALLDLDPVLLRGWGVAVDEVPEGSVISGTIKAGIGWTTLSRLYRLIPVAEGSIWHRVVPRDDVDLPTTGAIINDDKTLIPFHKAALSRSRAIYVNVPSWDEAKGSKRTIRWYSCWTPEGLLENAASVTFAGAGVFSSLVYRAAQQAPSGPIPFEVIDISALSPRTARPTVVIHYYTLHAGSTSWWETAEGSCCLVAISRYLENNRFDGYWSGNDVVRPYFRHRLKGVECQPKVAGTNSLRHHTACMFIFSSKVQSEDDAILEVLGLDPDDIRRAREDEDLIQFVHRGILRNGDFGGTYDIHLYSRDQAERLRDYLVENEITDDVRLIGVDSAGIMEVERPEPKDRSRKAATDPQAVRARAEVKRQKACERSQRNRDRDKAAKIANGTYQGPGAPRKAA